MHEHKVPRLFHVITGIALAVTAVLGVMAVRTFPLNVDAYIILIAVVAAVSESYAPVVGGYSASLTFPLLMSALLLGGPMAGAVVAGASAITPGSFSSEKGVVTSAYNFAQHTAIALVGGWLYVAMGGTQVPFHSADFPKVLLPLLVAALACALGNILFTAIGVGILYGIAPRNLAPAMLGYAPSLLALAAVGYLMAQVMAVNQWALPLFVFPLWVARQLYQSFVHLREAYTDTIRSLVNALEAKDPYTHGHSERVAGYAVAIGHRTGMDAESLTRIEHAGLLHDLGKLSIRAQVLRKPSALDPEERAVIARHPSDGAVMISKIAPLRDLAPAVVQHHERPDGTGYPEGLTGDDICIEARILAIADCFDAMTTNRPYRPALAREAAIQELRQQAGTQFDARLVESFVAHLVDRERATYASEEAPASVPVAGEVAS